MFTGLYMVIVCIVVGFCNCSHIQRSYTFKLYNIVICNLDQFYLIVYVLFIIHINIETMAC